MLSVPRPQEGQSPFEIDLTLAYHGEASLPALASASSGNALSLIATFQRAYSSLARAYSLAYREVELATVMSRKRQAVLVLDMAPQILKEKGLSTARNAAGSADLRQAICYADDQYCKIENYRAAVESIKELVKLKLDSMRSATFAAQCILKGTAPMSSDVRHTGTEQPVIEEVLEASQDIPFETPVTTHRGFGKPLY